MQIHVVHEGQRLGPFSLKETNRRLARGEVTLADLAWYEGIQNWIELAQIPGVSMPEAAPPDATPSPAASPTFYAGFWIRTLAFLIDAVVLIVLFLILDSALPATHSPVLNIFLNIAIQLAYFSLLWSSTWRASLGQKFCSLRVVSAGDGSSINFRRSLGRCLALLLSFSALLVGVIMVAFSARKQGLHDRLARTCVLKI